MYIITVHQNKTFQLEREQEFGYTPERLIFRKLYSDFR